MITIDNGEETRTLESFGFRELADHDNPVTSDYTSKMIHVPGQIGQWDFGEEIESKSFSVPCKGIFKNEKESQRALDRLLIFLFSPDRTPRKLKIIYDYDDDKFIHAKVRSNFSPNRKSILKGVDIPFLSSDPKRYSRFANDEVTWGSTIIDFTFPYTLGHEGLRNNIQVSGATNLDIKVDGFNLKPIIQLSGTGTNVVISNKGQVIRIPSFVGSTIVIDCQKYTMTKNGVVGFLDFDDFILYRGDNRVAITGTNLNLKLSITYRDEY